MKKAPLKEEGALCCWLIFQIDSVLNSILKENRTFFCLAEKKRRKKGKDGMNVPFPFKARFKLQFSIFGLISILAGLDTWEIPSFLLMSA